MTHIEDVLLHSLGQKGDRYVFQVAVDFDNPNPDVFDCSGLVQWSCHRARVKPRVPRSSWQQAQHCIVAHGLKMTVDEGVATRGALLFKFTEGVSLETLTSRPKQAHVAWSLGDGTTMEAKGTKFLVGSYSSLNRGWTHAARLPGVEYSPRGQFRTETDEESEMTKVVFFKGKAAGEVHPYAINGIVGKHLTPEAVALYKALGAEVRPSNEPLDQSFRDGVALLDGPLRNVA
jgi:hypothetical protein